MKALLATLLLLQAPQASFGHWFYPDDTIHFETIFNITCPRSSDFYYKVETKEHVWAFGAWYHTEGTGNGTVAGISDYQKTASMRNSILEFHVEIRHNCGPGGSSICEKIDPLTCLVQEGVESDLCTINVPSIVLGSPSASC